MVRIALERTEDERSSPVLGPHSPTSQPNADSPRFNGSTSNPPTSPKYCHNPYSGDTSPMHGPTAVANLSMTGSQADQSFCFDLPPNMGDIDKIFPMSPTAVAKLSQSPHGPRGRRSSSIPSTGSPGSPGSASGLLPPSQRGSFALQGPLPLSKDQADAAYAWITNLRQQKKDTAILPLLTQMPSNVVDDLYSLLLQSPELVLELCTKERGNVIVQLIEMKGAEVTAELISAIIEHTATLVVDQSGCIAFTRVYDASGEGQQRLMSAKVLENFNDYAIHQYANYAVQRVVKGANPVDHALVLTRLTTNLPETATVLGGSKFGSHVLETFLTGAEEALFQECLRQYLSDAQLANFFCNNKFANYVLQVAMRRACLFPAFKGEMVELIKPHLFGCQFAQNIVKSYSYGAKGRRGDRGGGRGGNGGNGGGGGGRGGNHASPPPFGHQQNRNQQHGTPNQHQRQQQQQFTQFQQPQAQQQQQFAFQSNGAQPPLPTYQPQSTQQYHASAAPAAFQQQPQQPQAQPYVTAGGWQVQQPQQQSQQQSQQQHQHQYQMSPQPLNPYTQQQQTQPQQQQQHQAVWGTQQFTATQSTQPAQWSQ